MAAAVKLLVPRIPLLLRTTFSHTLGLDSDSSKWDLKTTLIITAIRSIMVDSGMRTTVTKQQRFSLRDPGVKKGELIAKDTFPAPAEDDVCELLWRAIDALSDQEAVDAAEGAGEELYIRPELLPVSGEWICHAPSDSHSKTPSADASPAASYAAITTGTTSPLTVLYFHGGAYYLMDPASHRAPNALIARLTGGRCFSVRYRLAPQHPFPAALLDALVAYLSLLYPAPGALHEPVEARNIVFAGDSAGGGLSLALCLLLLWIQREGGGSVMWNGRKVDVPIPGGVTGNAPWSDITRSSPSYHTNARYDYLPPPVLASAPSLTTSKPSFPPPCPAWPSPPPRADFYSPNWLQNHPLVSPLAATASMWSDRPPMYICVGQEMLGDEARIVARRCLEARPDWLRFEQYEAQPHVFAMIVPDTPIGKRCFDGWTTFMRDVVSTSSGETNEEQGVDESRALWIEAKPIREKHVDLEWLTKDLTDEVVQQGMKNEMEARNKQWASLQNTQANGAVKSPALDAKM